MTNSIRATPLWLAALLFTAAAARAQELPSLPDLPPTSDTKLKMPLPDVAEIGLPSLDEIDPELLREKSLCVFPFIQAEAGGSDAARSKYQESLQQVFYDVAKESPVLKDPLFLKRPPACGYRDTECIAGIGGFSHCENVLVGSSTPVDNGFLLSVRLIDVAKKKATARVDEVVVAEKEEQIAAWAEGHACRALKVDCKGEVALDLDRPDMVPVIDRRPVPRKPSASGGAEKISLPVGLHMVRVSIGRRSSLERPLVIRRKSAPARITARQLSDCAIPVTIGGELKNELPQPASVECRGISPQKITGVAMLAVGALATGIATYEIIHGRSQVSSAASAYDRNGGAYFQSEAAKLDSGVSNTKLGTGLLYIGVPILAVGTFLTIRYW